MANQTGDPLLDKSYAIHFFVLSTLLLVCTVWAVWDEVYTRRPWKNYQKQYKKLRKTTLNQKLDKARMDWQKIKRSPAYIEIEKQLAAERKRLASPEIKKEISTVQQSIQQAELSSHEKLAEFRKKNGEYQNEQQYNPQSTNIQKLQAEAREKFELWQQTLRQTKQYQKRLAQIYQKQNALSKKLQAYKKPIIDLEKKLLDIDKQPVTLKELYIEELQRGDRCISCHVGIVDGENSYPQPFTRHPGDYLKKHAPEKFGCTSCHRGQSYATTAADAHGNVKHWLTPMLKHDYLGADCQKCHQDLRNLPGAPILTQGYQLFYAKGCLGCHQKQGFYPQKKIGPPWRELKQKVKPSWLYQWLKKPEHYFSGHRMPDFHLTEQEIQAITSYMFSLPTVKPVEIQWDPVLLKSEDDLSDAEYDQWDKVFAEGSKVFSNSRCNICHITGRGGGVVSFAPPLTTIQAKIADRDWLYSWIKNPRNIFSQSSMPHYQFSEKELKALVHYLFKHTDYIGDEEIPFEISKDKALIAQGKKLVSYYGCSGCHEIPGHENEGKVGPDLSNFGDKPLQDLYLDTKKYGSREQWLLNKLQNPRFSSELKMPFYDFKEDQCRALINLVTGFSDKKMPVAYQYPTQKTLRPSGAAAQLIDKYQCLSCHRIRGSGATYAPDLTYEGSKVQYRWLKDFLLRPNILRPMLQQMPKFNMSEQEAEILADYISLALTDPRQKKRLPQKNPKLVEAGKKIYRAKGCYACHQIGNSGGVVGPLLSNTGNRLQFDYLWRHLKNPLAVNPEIREPNFNLSDDETTAIAEYLYSLKIFTPPIEQTKPFVVGKLTMAVSPFLNSSTAHPYYLSLAKIIEQKTKWPIDMIFLQKMENFEIHSAEKEYGIIICDPAHFFNIAYRAGYKPVAVTQWQMHLVAKEPGPRGKRIAYAKTGLISLALGKIFPRSNLVPCFNEEEAIKAIFEGRADTAAVSSHTFHLYKKSHNVPLFDSSKKNLPASALIIAVHPHLPIPMRNKLKKIFTDVEIIRQLENMAMPGCSTNLKILRKVSKTVKKYRK